MNLHRLSIYSLIMAATLVVAWIPSTSNAAGSAKKMGVVFQVSDGDPKKWGLALNNAQNVQEDLGKDKVDIEIVAYGPGLSMLKLESEVGGRVKDAMEKGIKVVACENTMSKQKLTRDDMLPGLGYAKSGVVELMLKQADGYAYIRP